MTAVHCASEIRRICAKMFAIRPFIHTENRQAVETYLDTTWKEITTLSYSLASSPLQSDDLKERFQSYVDAEEQRLKEGLEIFKYNIDAIDTLRLITGAGRIEKVS